MNCWGERMGKSIENSCGLGERVLAWTAGGKEAEDSRKNRDIYICWWIWGGGWRREDWIELPLNNIVKSKGTAGLKQPGTVICVASELIMVLMFVKSSKNWKKNNICFICTICKIQVSGSINKVLLVHRHSRVFMYCLCLLLCDNLADLNRLSGIKGLTIKLFTEKVDGPLLYPIW